MAAQPSLAWLDGSFVPLAQARISPLDRGFLFGDAVYEVLPVYDGRPFLVAEHLARLERSLREMRIPNPRSRSEWAALFQELVARNGGGDLNLYLQVSRGVEAARNHAITAGLAPTVFLMVAPRLAQDPAVLTDGLSAITVPDPRWKRCDIKSTALLGNVFAKTAAVDAGVAEAILLADGELREGASSSVLVVAGGTLMAPPYGPEILPGTTRDLCLGLAADAGIQVRIAPIRSAALASADEILLGFASRGVLPVTRLDGAPVGSGKPGPVWRRLSELFDAYRRRVAGTPLM
ncbi:MAG TPA: aminotransferase class IV [Steroidobacteraceae bacterium]|nr:aminotransferase class IV [Steroidobacteraceae bacterium]